MVTGLLERDPDERSATPSRPPTPRRAWIPCGWRLALPGLVLITYVTAGWLRRWTVDDAFILHRVVNQIEAGNGPVFNAGERVEAATSTLWLALLTVADVLSPLRIEWTAVVLQLALGCVGLAAGMAGALRLERLRAGIPAVTSADRRVSRAVVPLGAVVYLSVATTWDWATGGLENGLALAWLGAAFLLVVSLVASRQPVHRARLPVTALVAGLGVLVRPDFAPFSAAFLVPVAWAAWQVGRARRLLLAALAAGALPATVQILRMGYYGQLFPNPLYAKEGLSTWWWQGWKYLVNFADPYLLVVPTTLTAAWLVVQWRGSGRAAEWKLVVVALEASVLLHVLSVVRVGGDYMHGRLLHVSWFALLLPILAVRLADLRGRGTALLTVGFGLWAAAALATMRPPTGSMVNRGHHGRPAESFLLDERGAQTGIVDGRNLVRLNAIDPDHLVTAGSMKGGALADALRPEPGRPPTYRETVDGPSPPVRADVGHHVIGLRPIGAPSATLPVEVYVYDMYGLADIAAARVALERRGTPGHEKLLPPPWPIARFVDPSARVEPAALAQPDLAALLAGTTVTTDARHVDADIAAARRALGCGELARLIDATRAPLTPSRFLLNMVESVRLRDARYPADPRAAEAELCRGG